MIRQLLKPDWWRVGLRKLPLTYGQTCIAGKCNCAPQGGFVIFLCGKNGKSSPLMWTSHKLKKVVKSSMAAESMSMSEGAAYAVLLNPITYGGILAQTIRLLTTTLKRLYLAPPNFVTFSFYLLDTF